MTKISLIKAKDCLKKNPNIITVFVGICQFNIIAVVCYVTKCIFHVGKSCGVITFIKTTSVRLLDQNSHAFKTVGSFAEKCVKPDCRY